VAFNTSLTAFSAVRILLFNIFPHFALGSGGFLLLTQVELMNDNLKRDEYITDKMVI
jgi:hypothetical protein